MSNLPLGLGLPQTQTQWSAILNPVINNALVDGRAVNGIVLIANVPLTVNHGLGRNQIGWIVTDNNASTSVSRTQPFNSQTLTLESGANCTINLWVY